MKKTSLTVALLVVGLFLLPVDTQSKDLAEAKKTMELYVNTWLNNTNDSWLVKMNGVSIPPQGLEVGLKALEENLKKSDLPKAEKQKIKERYIQTYIDQSAILAMTYQDLLQNPEIDILLQEFLRQAATQLWLENEMKKDPSAVVPTNEEIERYYQENSERLLRLGLSASQIKAYTDQELRQTKLQQWTYQKLAKFKKENPVTINEKLKKKYDLQ